MAILYLYFRPVCAMQKEEHFWKKNEIMGIRMADLWFRSNNTTSGPQELPNLLNWGAELFDISTFAKNLIPNNSIQIESDNVSIKLLT